jgi:transposase
LGIDDFALHKGQCYATGLHDLMRRRLFEVVEGRTSAVLKAALVRLPQPETVQVVSMDMSGAFRAAVHEVLPAAAIVVDKFHVVARVNDAVSSLLASSSP